MRDRLLSDLRAARERQRARRLDVRRRHAALAARLAAMPAAEAAALVRRARAVVDRWEREELCSAHYISRWRARLAGPPQRAAAALLEHDEWTNALLQNSPWSFALDEDPASASRAKATGQYISATKVLSKLRRRLASARRRAG
jgi:hypothetical protein